VRLTRWPERQFYPGGRTLFISQPAVTGHIKALEEHYQITLLRRTARRVELTEEGIAAGGHHPQPCLVWWMRRK
jgi:DNA-binding transcriptional LysR family regulator